MAIVAGESTTLKVDVSDTLTAVTQVITMSGPDSSTPEVETTSLDSTAKTYRANNKHESGTFDFTVNLDPSDSAHKELMGLLESGNTVSWEVGWNDGSTLEFEGFVTSRNYGGMEDEGNLEAEFSVRITGDVTFTEAV